jgi:hypothetical protein
MAGTGLAGNQMDIGMMGGKEGAVLTYIPKNDPVRGISSRARPYCPALDEAIYTM